MTFDPEKDRVAIIAGGGSLPLELARACEQKGNPAFILALREDVDAAIAAFDHVMIGVGQLGKVFSLTAERQIQHLIFAGSIKKRPDLKSMKLDWQTAKFLPKVLPLLAKGDNSLLSGLMTVIENEGLTMVGAHEVAPELLAPEGAIVGKKPDQKTRTNIEIAYRAAKRLGDLDAGQATIVEGGRVLALEGAEGTNLMIERVSELRKIGRLSTKKRQGVLVKTMKPNQDERADLPAIGPQTVEAVADAGLSGIAVEAHKSLILQVEETKAVAKKLGIFIYGIGAAEFSNADQSSAGRND